MVPLYLGSIIYIVINMVVGVFMKVIIAGSRSITDKEILERTIKESMFNIDTILCRMCYSGVDKLAVEYALKHKVPIDKYNAEWDKYGTAAGPIRNKKMVENADALIAIWDGKSRGTKNVVMLARKKKLPTILKVIK